jgi:hypothetical protein
MVAAPPLVFVQTWETIVCPAAAVPVPYSITIEFGSVNDSSPLTMTVGSVLRAAGVGEPGVCIGSVLADRQPRREIKLMANNLVVDKRWPVRGNL